LLLTIKELRNRVDGDLGSLIEELSELTGRGGDNERLAWERSLPRLTQALIHPALDRIHVHFARREHHVALEYQLPGVASWCDVVLLGRHQQYPSAIVIELKDWETNQDRPGKAEGLIERRGMQELHPSDQVRGYVEYCQKFHSTVLENKASVHGFVLFTTGLLKQPYIVAPNERLAAAFPLFTMASEDLSDGLPTYLSSRLSEQDSKFATHFVTGTFRQDRGFMSQIGRTILGGDTRHFELLDNQRRAFHLCLATTRELMAAPKAARRVIVVDGPPGSGKSAVAARLWASLVTDESIPDGNVLLVTTSQSQNSNWVHLIDQATAARAGRGVARRATSFSPIGIPHLSRLRKECGDSDLYKNALDWRDHLMSLTRRGIPPQPGAESDSVLVSLVDEAHALINPEREHGVGQYGFVTGLGPQAYHIMRCSRLTVFFLDPVQSFRVRENTAVQDIDQWARELGATVENVSLHGAQFRCAGSAEYVAWIESLLSGATEEMNRVFASAWYRNSTGIRPVATAAQSGDVAAIDKTPKTGSVAERARAVGEPAPVCGVDLPGAHRPMMDFHVYGDPFSMERDLRGLSKQNVVRLLSTYSRVWKTQDSTYPHRLPAQELDFYEPVVLTSGAQRVWSRPWNFVPGNDYTGFVAGRAGLPISEDPLCEVGCTYAVRGFDFDYVGLLWLNDLLWRDGRWVVPLENVHESGIARLVSQAKREGALAPAGPKGANVLEKVGQAYRILLTRAIRGIFLWIPDEETRRHVLASLSE
jgi:uncharacterized protein